MSIFQPLHDSYFILKCATQLKDVVPDSSGFATTFCTLTRSNLLSEREQGANHEEAVRSVCLYLLENAEAFIPSYDPGFEKTHCVQMAQKYCKGFIDRWPNDSDAPGVAEALSHFASYAKSPSSPFFS